MSSNARTLAITTVSIRELRPMPCNSRRIRDRGAIWEIKPPAASEGHPTNKPAALVPRAQENCNSSRDVALDPFLGSGSTLIAAERAGHTCVGMELDPLYCKVTFARRESFTGETAKPIEGGVV